MLTAHADIFGWQERAITAATVKPWKPTPLGHDAWATRDYRAVYAWRMRTLQQLRDGGAEAIAGAKRYYSTRPGEFIMHWMDTYDPRKSPHAVDPELRGSKWMPFVFFTRQDDFIVMLHELRLTAENGLVEKCRDAGATWLSCAYSVWSWLFIESDAIGWGSRKQELVDKIGDASSIFEKLRLIIMRLPDIWRPKGLKPRDHLTFMKCINPENGSTITGETGDNIGRGGRTSMYFKDESAHYERPEKIESALGDNTNVQVDISSVNGLGNVFHRRRESGSEWSRNSVIDRGVTRVFIIDWTHHPDKTQAWYDQRKAKAEREGLQHVFAQEVERNYSAAVLNTIIAYEWIEAAVDAHLVIPYLAAMGEAPNTWGAGLDVADEGLDKNAITLRQWIIARHCEESGSRDPGVITRNAIMACRPYRGIQLQYDCIGVGAAVKSEYNRLTQDTKELRPDDVRLVPWNAGAAVVNPFDRLIPNDRDSILNKDMFGNFKAQAWWNVRTRFYKTWRVIQSIKAGGPIEMYDPEELISLDSKMPNRLTLMKELAQPQKATSSGLRMIIDKTPPGTKSPNMGDSFVMAFCPAPVDVGAAAQGSYSQ